MNMRCTYTMMRYVIALESPHLNPLPGGEEDAKHQVRFGSLQGALEAHAARKSLPVNERAMESLRP